MHALYTAGRFRRFHPPAKLISVFPTLTDPAYDVFFGTGPTPGYEAGGFDRARNRTDFALWQYLRGTNEAWVRQVDYRLSFLKDAIMYLLPRRVYRGELRRARQVLDQQLACGRAQVILYILSTDGLGHMLTPPQIEQELARLDDWVESVLKDYPNGLEIVMLADHGLGAVPPGCPFVQRFDLAGVLRAAQLNVVRRLRGAGDVVLPTLGLLDVARLHCFDADARNHVVAVLRSQPEIEIVAARVDTRVEVFAGPAEAAIHRRAAGQGPPLFRYEPRRGDPLELAPACAALRAAGEMDGDGFATARAWLRATADAPFPAAPQRLWEGLFSISREQPDVVVSLADGWYVGSGLLSRFVRMQGTHGGLHRRVSETFVMATHLEFDSPTDLPAVADQLRRTYAWPLRRDAPA